MIQKILIIFFALSFNFCYSLAQDTSWFTDVSSDVGLDVTEGSRVWVADINGDLYPDFITGTGKAGKNNIWLFINEANGQDAYSRIFTDQTDESGINVNRDTEKEGRIADIANLADLDNDGDLDLITSIYYHRWEYYNTPEKDPGDRPEVYLNDGTGKFTIKEDAGLYDFDFYQFMTQGLTNTTAQSFLDFDYDGNIDMYLAQWFQDYANNTKMTDILMKGNGDGTFTFIDDAAISSVREPMYGANVTDWNNDGWPDVITSGYCRSGGSIFMNMKDGTFEDVSQEANYSGQHLGGDHGQPICQWEAQPADFDNDGDIDLLQVSVHGGYNSGEGRTTISVNQGAEFGYRYEWDLERLERDAPISSHVGDMGGTWIDFDNDMKQDVAIGQFGYLQANTSGQSRLYMLRQNEDGQFEDITKDLGFFDEMKQAHSLEPVDYDLDGDNDLMFTREETVERMVDGELQNVKLVKMNLLRNDIGNKNNWISVKLDAPEDCNRSAIGARITVWADGNQQIRELLVGEGHFSNQQPLIKNFGLSTINRIDSVIVRWPRANDQFTVIQNPPINSFIEIDGSGNVEKMNIRNESGAIAQFDVPYLFFDQVNVGESANKTVSLTNTGDGPLSISAINLQDVEDSAFEIVSGADDLPLVLQNGESIDLEVKFTPAKRHIYKPYIALDCDALNANGSGWVGVDIEAIGFEEQPMARYDKDVIFHDAVIDPIVDVLTITNFGEVALTVQNIEFLSNFRDAYSFSSEDIPFDIEPNSSKEITITFAPIYREEYSAQLEITTNAYNKPLHLLELSAEADVPTPEINVSTGFILFGGVAVGDSKTRPIGIRNDGDGVLTIESIELEDDFYEHFTWDEYETPFEIEPESSIDLPVLFKPLEIGDYDTKMIIRSNSIDNQVEEVSFRANSDEVISVNDLETSEEEIRIFPNPAVNNAELRLNNAYLIDKVRIAIYDMKGTKYVDFSTPADDSIELPISELAPGAYHIIISSGNYRANAKLIKADGN